MDDLPTGAALLALARDMLLSEILPALPQELRFDARLVANGMAIAEREAAAGRGPAQEICQKLDALYTDAAPTQKAPSYSLPRERGRVRVGAADEGTCEPLRSFARDLRVGAFEDSDRQARDVLWRLTIAKLRLANPRFLAANGFR